MMKQSAPNWGKAIGIIMICLGAFGFFHQIYKIIFPVLLNFQQGIIKEVSRLNPDTNRHEEIVFNSVGQMMAISETEANLLRIFGVLGILLCVVYIVAGAKLLTASPANYKLAKVMLIVFIIFNLSQGSLIFVGSASLIFTVILVYALGGLAFDIVLLIILLTSDKSAYGINDLGTGGYVERKSEEEYL